MLEKLIKLANQLDRAGHTAESNYLDQMITKLAQPASDQRALAEQLLLSRLDTNNSGVLEMDELDLSSIIDLLVSIDVREQGGTREEALGGILDELGMSRDELDWEAADSGLYDEDGNPMSLSDEDEEALLEEMQIDEATPSDLGTELMGDEFGVDQSAYDEDYQNPWE